MHGRPVKTRLRVGHGIDAGPAVVQGGLTLALQSILPLLPLDYAKDSNCGALFADARAEGASTSTRPAAKKTVAAPVQPKG